MMSTNDAGTGQGKVQELISFVKKKLKLGRKKKEDELDIDEEEEQLSKEEKEELNPDKAIGGASMLDGEHGKIFGVSRPVVVGIGLFIFLVFSFALIFATDDSSDNKEKKPQQVAESNINKSTDERNNKLPSDYETLAKQDPSHKNAQNKNGQNVPGQNGAPATVQAQRTSSVPAQQAVSQPVTTTVPRVTSVAAPPAYSQPYQVPASVATPAPAAAPASSSSSDDSSSKESSSQEKSLRERIASAIAFGLGGGSADFGSATASSGDGGASASSGGSGGDDATATAADNVSYASASTNTLTAGTTIPAMLLTGIDTSVQGQVKAQVMADVYNYSGNNLLIPAGSQILGSYSSGGGNTNNKRVQVNFDTLIMPDGGTWNIGKSMTAIDGDGYMGIEGRLHHHTGANFAKGLMNSALTALSTIGVDNVTMDLSAYQYLTNASNNVNITVDPGYQFSLYVTNNINF